MSKTTEDQKEDVVPADAKPTMQFFLTYLNKIFCAKTHFAERLPELADQAEFRDLSNAILETLDDIMKQLPEWRKFIFCLMLSHLRKIIMT